MANMNLRIFSSCRNPVDTGHKLNVYKTFRRRPGRPMCVQFKSCVYGETSRKNSNNSFFNVENNFFLLLQMKEAKPRFCSS